MPWQGEQQMEHTNFYSQQREHRERLKSERKKISFLLASAQTQTKKYSILLGLCTLAWCGILWANAPEIKQDKKHALYLSLPMVIAGFLPISELYRARRAKKQAHHLLKNIQKNSHDFKWDKDKKYKLLQEQSFTIQSIFWMAFEKENRIAAQTYQNWKQKCKTRE